MALQEIMQLDQLFRYDPISGKLFNRVRRSSNALEGQEAGFLNGNGYRRITLPSRKKLYTHQVVWALVNGTVPDGEIDHIDGNRLNNRIDNLREVTRFGNTQNSAKRAHSLQPYKGVRRTRDGTWAARIAANKRRYHLGTFDTAEAARAAYSAAAQRLHQEFARAE